MPVRSLSLCNLVAIWLETLLYGSYVVFLVPTVNLLFHPLSGSDRKFNRPYLAGMFALWTFSTVHLAAGLAMLLEAFVLIPESSSEFYFSRATNPLHVLRTAAYLANIVFANAFMIHHVYILWYRSVVSTLIPLFTLTLFLASGIFVFTLSAHRPNLVPILSASPISIGLSDSLTPTLRILVPVHIGLSLITNSYITILVGIRLWRQSLEAATWTFRKGFIIVVGGTGVVFPFVTLIALIYSVAGMNGQIIPFTTLTPLAAIIFTVMILNVKLGYIPHDSDSRLTRHQRIRCNNSSFEFVPATAEIPVTATPMITTTPSDLCHPPSPPVAYFKPGKRSGFKPDHGTLLPLGSAALKNTRIPPVPSNPPPVPFRAKRRMKVAPASSLKVMRESGYNSPPTAPHTPTPRTEFPSPFETHFPRRGVQERLSRQTFDPRRESVGNGGTAYTTFGNSELARMLANARKGGEKLPSDLVPPGPGVSEEHKNQRGQRKKDKRKRLVVVNPRLAEGVHMTKATERKIDYIDEEMS